MKIFSYIIIFFLIGFSLSAKKSKSMVTSLRVRVEGIVANKQHTSNYVKLRKTNGGGVVLLINFYNGHQSKNGLYGEFLVYGKSNKKDKGMTFIYTDNREVQDLVVKFRYLKAGQRVVEEFRPDLSQKESTGNFSLFPIHFKKDSTVKVSRIKKRTFHRWNGPEVALCGKDNQPVSEAEWKEAVSDRTDLAKKTLSYVQEKKKIPELEVKLLAFEKKAKDQKGSKELYDEIAGLRREILFSHPDLDFDKILINRNPPTKYSHNGDQHLGRHSRVGPGLTIISDWKSGNPKATALFEGKLPKGAIRNPDLNYDADKVVFAFCDHEYAKGDNKKLRFFLYEAAIDGSWVKKLTGTERDKFETWDDRATVLIEDNDPCYLPDGDLVFISTRSQSYGRCHGGRYNPAWVLHRCDSNGDNVKQLSFGNENEYEPSVLNDGRIIFTRWEYTNRHEMFFHMLWTCRPDGSNVTHFYGNDTIHPMMVTESSAIPGTHKVVATAMGHHSFSTGTTEIIDTHLGENGEKPITHITNETPYSESSGWPKPNYSHPYAINEEIYLVSRANHRVQRQGRAPIPNDRAIFIVDAFGGREFIYEDPDVASFSPIAVRKRKRPPIIPSTLAPGESKYGTVFLQNAYLTRNDPENKIKPGSIKALRINALGVQPRNRASDCSRGVPNEIPKKILGTVPVDENGSAFFKLPAKTSVQIQILDKDGRAILTEKSLFYLQPGESRSCIGCHEPVGTSPLVESYAKLARTQPVDITPPAGPKYPGGFSFMCTVQPVLDRYCIGCHGLGKGDPKANKLSLIHDGSTKYPSSYMRLYSLGNHRLGDKGFMQGSNEYLNISRPYQYYSYGSKIPAMLLANHGKTNMDRDSYMRIIEWLDLNAQCYGDLYFNKPEWRKLEPKGLEALRRFIKDEIGEEISKQPERALINVAQIDESRILLAPLAKAAGGWGQIKKDGKVLFTKKDDPKYKKLVELVDKAIIRNLNDNTNGWTPTGEQGANDSWVLKDRQEYIQNLQKILKK